MNPWSSWSMWTFLPARCCDENRKPSATKKFIQTSRRDLECFLLDPFANTTFMNAKRSCSLTIRSHPGHFDNFLLEFIRKPGPLDSLKNWKHTNFPISKFYFNDLMPLILKRGLERSASISRVWINSASINLHLRIHLSWTPKTLAALRLDVLLASSMTCNLNSIGYARLDPGLSDFRGMTLAKEAAIIDHLFSIASCVTHSINRFRTVDFRIASMYQFSLFLPPPSNTFLMDRKDSGCISIRCSLGFFNDMQFELDWIRTPFVTGLAWPPRHKHGQSCNEFTFSNHSFYNEVWIHQLRYREYESIQLPATSRIEYISQERQRLGRHYDSMFAWPPQWHAIWTRSDTRVFWTAAGLASAEQ